MLHLEIEFRVFNSNVFFGKLIFLDKENKLNTLEAQRYAVVCCSDDNYAKYVSVVFNSVLLHTTKKSQIDFYCIDDGISETNKNIIINSLYKNGSNNIKFIKIDTDEFNNIETIKHITRAAFFRLRIPYILDESITKALYLDCDLIVKSDITSLWDVNLLDQPVAAVENISRRTHLKTGLKQSEYFNSGVLLMNLPIWRDNKLPENIFEFKKNNPDKISTNDQCAINCIVNNNWVRLPLKWNHQTGIYRNKDIRTRYASNEIEEAMYNPSIIHFIGSDKPWNKNCYHPWKEEYVAFASKIGVDLKTISNYKLFIHSLTSFSLFKKFIRTRLQILKILKYADQ